MKNIKSRLGNAIAAASIVGLVMAAPASAATTGNVVSNYWRSTGTVRVQSPTGWYTLYPGHQSDQANIQCLIPSKDAYSQYHGFYAKDVKRCFVSNNNFLLLTVG
jgi:hypothetical protein